MKLLCRIFMLTAALTVAMAASATRVDTEGTDFAASQTDSVNRAVATIVGANINQVIDELVSMNVPVDRVTVGKYLAAYFAGADLGFAHKDASNYINDIIYAAAPQGVPDSLSIESQKATSTRWPHRPAPLSPLGPRFHCYDRG